MLRYFIQKVHRRRRLAKPRLVVAVPSGITGVEQSAVKEAGRQAGARRVYIIEEPMAAAIGAGLPVYEPAGSRPSPGDCEQIVDVLGVLEENDSTSFAVRTSDGALVVIPAARALAGKVVPPAPQNRRRAGPAPL
jgi:rod shape-determining protein MreB and related proteins